ncbi:composite domain of metallo-dependent hydrolase [Daedalea quercina L-15889]|uniref:Composite domain of metallo-dependent hydrolase n=1 Tax=Daedalea quercina L-15889 TaxID=1314783 RepID=A0A165R6A0_9APHY|nr:composite domain of metallo-dependent hydrolase [Daedalea quercina L-15889]
MDASSVLDARRRSSLSRTLLLALCTAVATATVLTYNTFLQASAPSQRIHHVPLNAETILSQCTALRETPRPPTDFFARDASDRFEPGTKSTLIKNARIWTGARNGTEIVYGDVYLDKGVVKGIGYIPDYQYTSERDVIVVDAKGGWVTPGLVDLHSHLGVSSVPELHGALDVNSGHGPIVPWLRSIDGFNTHDDAFQLAIAGGVTSVQVLPGSANAIAGQAFMFKLRKTSDHTPLSMVLEPPHTLNGSASYEHPMRWRHLKQACGESLLAYGNRMDSMWSYRWAYNEARKIKEAQDAYCAKAEAGLWDELKGQVYPESSQWEVMVDVLRGRVKVSTHCYEEVDLDSMVRLTNEFEFPIASFHHASEAWLVPNLLKRTWGGTPTVGVFAAVHRYKRESFRGSAFAPRVLADSGIPVVMKSDHPILNSRYLMYEAQQAHYWGLPPHLALLSVTAVPASAAGMSHRIGVLQEGADADVVLWDSHPLQLGATPRKVWIDGILQVGAEKDNIIVGKGKEGREFQEVPNVPNWDKEREDAVKWEGLPPLAPTQYRGRVLMRNVREVTVRDLAAEDGLKTMLAQGEPTDVVVDGGRITCVGKHCLGGVNAEIELDLRGGVIAPSLMTFGSPLGVEEIMLEPSTGDGVLFDPLHGDPPAILGDKGGLVRTADALKFGTRNALLAHRAGVTYATSSLEKTTYFASPAFIAGLSVTFRTGSAHALERGAVIKQVTALHVVLSRTSPSSSVGQVSVSTQIAVLRRLLLNGEPDDTETGYWFKRVAQGAIPLVIDVASADIMAVLLKLKIEIEQARGSFMKLVFFGATEAHLIAEEIAGAKIGVILEPARPFPQVWDDRRILAGPPLTNQTSLIALIDAGVTVAVGCRDAWQPVNTRFDVAWAALETNGRITRQKAQALVSTNLEKLLDIEGWVDEDGGDLVAYEWGNVFELTSKPVAVASPRRGLVDVL